MWGWCYTQRCDGFSRSFVIGVGRKGVSFPHGFYVIDRTPGTHGWTSSSGGERGRRADGPLVAVGTGLLELLVQIRHAVSDAILYFADFDIVVVPAEVFLLLQSR